MDNGGIYEEGTPAEIFDNPKRLKTQVFIYKVRSYEFAIDSPDFDHVAMLSGIDGFCFNHAVDTRIAAKLRLIAEELVINIVVPAFGACNMSINFSEKLNQYSVEVTYLGENSHAIEDAEDDLAVTVIEGTASEISHTYDKGKNTIKLTVAN